MVRIPNIEKNEDTSYFWHLTFGIVGSPKIQWHFGWNSTTYSLISDLVTLWKLVTTALFLCFSPSEITNGPWSSNTLNYQFFYSIPCQMVFSDIFCSSCILLRNQNLTPFCIYPTVVWSLCILQKRIAVLSLGWCLPLKSEMGNICGSLELILLLDNVGSGWGWPPPPVQGWQQFPLFGRMSLMVIKVGMLGVEADFLLESPLVLAPYKR